MGLLALHDTPLDWKDIKPYVDHVKKHGIVQFINNYKRWKQRPDDVFKWGEEVEYMIVSFDDENRRVQLSLRAGEILAILQEKEKKSKKCNSLWQPELGKYMIEGTPGKPYDGEASQLNVVEANMRERREEVRSLLNSDERLMSFSVFPRLGCPGFTKPTYDIKGPESNPITRSIFFPDQAMNSHPRFSYITQNIRQRRGEKVAINIPIYKDERTPSPFTEEFSDPEATASVKTDHIYMDSTGLGFGNSCIQVTQQACNIDEAKTMYDQLAPVCPIMLALSAASPIFRGFLSDVDERWQVMSQSVDDRTSEERGLTPLKDCKHIINKSRCDSVDCYISEDSEIFNDIKIEIDQDTKETLTSAGVDEMLSQHFAHLWVRDPLMLYSGNIHQDDKRVTEHFENILSSVWQSLRFKPPVSESAMGWRVEFRVMESQFTDFENAAFVIFVVLLTRVILAFKLDFRIPMSLVHENMKRAHGNDAVKSQLFHFRRKVFTEDTPACCALLFSQPSQHLNHTNVDREANNMSVMCHEISINTIVNGAVDEFPGFIPLIQLYLRSLEIEPQAKCRITEYLDFISKKTSGALMTAAQWTRHFVTSHTEYNRDSIVTDSIAYDLLRRIDSFDKGEVVNILSKEFSC